jgi:hypothetical protein
MSICIRQNKVANMRPWGKLCAVSVTGILSVIRFHEHNTIGLRNKVWKYYSERNVNKIQLIIFKAAHRKLTIYCVLPGLVRPSTLSFNHALSVCVCVCVCTHTHLCSPQASHDELCGPLVGCSWPALR